MNESGVWQFVVNHWVEIIWGFIVVSAIILLVKSVIIFFNRRNLEKREMVWLELTPPASIVRTPEATEQLFSVIHGMYAARHIKEKLLSRSPVMSFEIVSTKQNGIRYLVQIEKLQASGLQKVVAAYMPDVKVKEINEPERSIGQVIEFKETGHYVLPLTLPLVFEQHDPLAYVTNAMTKLDETEYVSMQLVITPVKLREASRLSR